MENNDALYKLRNGQRPEITKEQTEFISKRLARSTATASRAGLINLALALSVENYRLATEVNILRAGLGLEPIKVY